MWVDEKIYECIHASCNVGTCNRGIDISYYIEYRQTNGHNFVKKQSCYIKQVYEHHDIVKYRNL